jgi:hypothetical protein
MIIESQDLVNEVRAFMDAFVKENPDIAIRDPNSRESWLLMTVYGEVSIFVNSANFTDKYAYAYIWIRCVNPAWINRRLKVSNEFLSAVSIDGYPYNNLLGNWDIHADGFRSTQVTMIDELKRRINILLNEEI